MAHFAKLDENNVVLSVHVVNNSELMVDGEEIEDMGIEFLQSLYGADTNWKQASYNGSFRKNYAGIGFTYNADIDAFVPPKPFNSWVLNNETAQWEAPTIIPDDGQMYSWNEDTQAWDALKLGGNTDGN